MRIKNGSLKKKSFLNTERNTRTGMKAKAGMWDWDDEKIKKEKARIEKALQSGFAILRADND